MFYLGFTLGLLNSLHCLGMCGPLVWALTAQGGRFTRQNWPTVSAYHLGRISVYGLLGLLAGSFGHLINWAGWQSYLSVAAGILMLLGAIGRLPHLASSRWSGWLHRGHRLIAGKRSVWARLATGALNGLLPCGLVYAAMAGAATSGSMAGGGSFMLLFGIGTLPALLLMQVARPQIDRLVSVRFRKLAPVGLLVVSIILLSRGLHHFQLPDSSAKSPEIPVCHGR